MLQLQDLLQVLQMRTFVSDSPDVYEFHVDTWREMLCRMHANLCCCKTNWVAIRRVQNGG